MIADPAHAGRLCMRRFARVCCTRCLAIQVCVEFSDTKELALDGTLALEARP
jgi:hypothetical protein